MILSISLARNAVFIDVIGCPCAHAIAFELTRRFAGAGFDAFAYAVCSSVTLRAETLEPDVEKAGNFREWALKRALAAGLALTWALEHGAMISTERREEPMADGPGVFSLDGWRADS